MKFISKNLGTVLFFTLFFTSVCYAKDFKGSLRNLQTEVQDILQIVGVISLCISGGLFYISKQKGLDHLTSAIIGTVVFGSSSTLFSVLMRIFA